MTNKIIESVLTNTSPAAFVGLDTETVVTLKGGKKNPMQGRVTKRTTGSNVMIFKNEKSNAYENMVNRRLAAEGKDISSFKVGPRQWGTRVAGTPFVQHKAGLYLEVIFLKAGKSEYFLDGKPIAKDAIIGLEEREFEGAESGQGGLSDENRVIIRTYALDSIKKIRIDKQEYNNE